MKFVNDYLDIIIFAVIAVALLWRLRSVLGEHGSEPPATLNLPAAVQVKMAEKALAQNGVEVKNPAVNDRWAQNLPNFDLVDTATVHSHLAQFLAVDPSFRPDEFVTQARKAFVLIVEGFATGNRTTLEMLLAPALFQSFVQQIERREHNQESYHVQLFGIKKAVIAAAELDGTKARITVDFAAEQSITQKHKDGTIVNDNDGHRRTTRDRWVFAKDLKDQTLGWLLVNTLAHEE